MCGILASRLIEIVKGIRSGGIKCKPLLIIDPEAENYNTTTVEDEIWADLAKCGIRERKPATN